MHKSSQLKPSSQPKRGDRVEHPVDKGQKFERYFIPALGRGRRTVAFELRMDQRR